VTPDTFREYWNTTYPKCLPLGYRLRDAYDSRWFRIHTLPNSKRYAESEEEYREILYRHNSVLTEVLGDGEPVILVATTYSETPTPGAVMPELAWQYPGLQPFLTEPNDEDNCAGYWHGFMTALSWRSGMADTLLQQVADEVIDYVLFVSMAHEIVYHPYDGGADVILPSPSDRDTLRDRYTSWLSSHPLGL
jgi:hypothetical protein